VKIQHPASLLPSPRELERTTVQRAATAGRPVGVMRRDTLVIVRSVRELDALDEPAHLPSPETTGQEHPMRYVINATPEPRPEEEREFVRNLFHRATPIPERRQAAAEAEAAAAELTPEEVEAESRRGPVTPKAGRSSVEARDPDHDRRQFTAELFGRETYL